MKQRKAAIESVPFRTRSAGRFRIGALILLTGFYFAIPNARPDFTKFNCQDSESYLALSYSLYHGLGYTRSMIPDEYVAHTTWPPGVPVLMLPAIAVSGKTINWLAVKAIMILVGIVGVAISWKLGERLSGKKSGGDFVALMVGLNPFYWDFSHQAMAELPLVVWILGSLLIIDYTWTRRSPKMLSVLLVGIVCGLGMLIKGHAIGLIIAPAAYWIGNRASLGNRRQHFIRLCVYGVGFILPFACWMTRNSFVEASGFDGISQIRMIHAKYPTQVDSPMLTVNESLGVIHENLFQYTIYRTATQVTPFLWYEPTYAWDGSGIIFVCLTVGIVGFVAPWKFSELLSLHFVCIPIALLNITYAFGGSPRFWIPISICVSVLLGIRCNQVTYRFNVSQRASSVILASICFVNLLAYVVDHERHPFNSGGWAEKAELFEEIRALDIKAIGAVSSNSSAFQLMTGIQCPMNVESRVDYVVVDLRRGGVDSFENLSPVVEVFPWSFFKLPQPMSVSQACLEVARLQLPSIDDKTEKASKRD